MTSEKERDQPAYLMSLWSGYAFSQMSLAPFDRETVFDTECLDFRSNGAFENTSNEVAPNFRFVTFASTRWRL